MFQGMEAVKYLALAICLTLCAVVSFSERVSGENGQMCGAIVTADDGDDWIALRNKAFSALRGACRRVQPTSRMQTVATKNCSFVTGSNIRYSRNFTFILKPLVPPFRLSFEVQAPKKAMILLAEERTKDSVFAEIGIGSSDNLGAHIRACYSGDNSCNKEADNAEVGLLSDVEFRTFWVDFKEGNITVGKGNEDAGFMTWNATAFHGREYPKVHVGIGTFGYKDRGDWVFHAFCE